MMGPLSRTVLLSLASLGALSAPVSFAQDVPAQDAAVARRQHAMRDAMQELQEARLAYSARRYSEAVEHYRAALASIPKAPATAKQQKFIKDSLSDALIAKAIDYRSVGRTDEAVEFLQEAVELSPDNQRAQLELVHTQDPQRTNPALSPQHVGDVAEVTRLLELAYGHMDIGKYDEAIKTFHDVRRIDPFNTAAMRGIEQAQKRRSTYFRTAHDSTRAKMLADVDRTWEEQADNAALPPELAGSAAADTTVQPDGDMHRAFAEGLEQMILPQIVFEEASVGEVLETLQNQIRRFETSGIKAARRINLSANFGAPNSEAYKEVMQKRVSLNLSEVSVRDVLDLLVSQLGITYYYTPIGVELSYSGKDFGPLIERSFTVPPHFFDPYRSDAEADEDDEEDSFEDSGSVAVRRINPVQVLKSMGISFPEGSSARYLPSTRTLHVRNTAFNMEEIADALNVPMGEERQIVLNVLIMQMSEKDLEDLGFDWLVKVGFNGELFGGGGVSQAASTAAGLPRITSVSPTEADYITSGLRSGTEAIGENSLDKLIETGSAYDFNRRSAQKAPGIFSLRGVWSAADVAVIMRGLSQKKGVDILQNPQLVFSPTEDEQVIFANVREMYYPETYEAGEISSITFSQGNNNLLDDAVGAVTGRDNQVTAVTATGSFPTDFVRFGVNDGEVGGIGTILQIHSAEVKNDGQYVDLALTTTVNEFEGFINWGSPIKSALWDRGGAGSSVEEAILGAKANIVEIVLSPNYILKPIFKRNLVNTSLTVVPGSVLVFAGLQDAKTVRYQDKVPVLGDLPLVGRFFRSEGEENTRKVLLYLAKVDLVDPSGRDVRTGERPGTLSDEP